MDAVVDPTRAMHSPTVPFMKLWWIVAALLALSGAAIVPRVMSDRAQAGNPATSARGAAGARGSPGQRRTTAPGDTVVSVGAARARVGDMGVYLTALGTVTSLQTVTVRTRVDGQLLSVRFQEGQLVHRGDLLAEIDPRPFQVQLIQAQGQAAKDEASLKNAQLDLIRYRNLLEVDAAPRQQVDAQVALVNQLQGSLESDRGQLEAARLNLTYTRITAPFTGYIGLRLVDPGNIVHVTDPNGLVVITQRQPIAVVFPIPQEDLPQVLAKRHAGQELQAEAFDSELQTKIGSGSLTSTDSQIDTTTGTIKLKAVFPNGDDALFPNQFVNVRLLLDTLRHVVIVPSAAVQHGPEGTYAYVVTSAGTVELRKVDVRATDGDQSAIGSGISSGDTVVTDGVDKIQQGMRVAVRMPETLPPKSDE